MRVNTVATSIAARLQAAGAPALPRVTLLRSISAGVRNTRSRSLTIFRMGLGRDSLAMLGLLIEGKLTAKGLRILPEDVDAVVFTDPGMEWNSTYQMIPRVQAVCDAYGLRFLVQAKAPVIEQRAWTAVRTVGSRADAPWRAPVEGETVEDRAARGYYHPRVGIMADYASKGMIVPYTGGGCTDVHKIGPNRALMDDLARERFGAWADNAAWGRAVKKGERPPHLVLIGIAADEVARQGECAGPNYEATAYPLVEAGIRKDQEQPILDRWNLGDAKKSGCVMCKFQPIGWYWALRELEPDQFREVCAYEANALKTSPNLLLFPKGVPGVPGSAKLQLAAAVDLWRAHNLDATVERVLEKTYSCEKASTKLKNPATSCIDPVAAFRADVEVARRAMAADGFELAVEP